MITCIRIRPTLTTASLTRPIPTITAPMVNSTMLITLKTFWRTMSAKVRLLGGA